MEEHQRGAFPRLSVGDGLPVDFYELQLSASHRFRPNVTRCTGPRPYPSMTPMRSA